MPLIPQTCPSCTSPLVVTQLNCTVCGTGVVGKFRKIGADAERTRQSLQQQIGVFANDIAQKFLGRTV